MWICKGIPQDGKKYDGVKAHAPHNNYEPKCEICGLPKEAAIKTSLRLPGWSIFLTGIIASTVLFLVIGFFRFNNRSCPIGEIRINNTCQAALNSQSTDNPLALHNYAWEPARFNWGQQALFSGEINVPRNKGIELFKAGKYAEAASFFQRAIAGNRNDPEVVILYNNALAHLRGNPLTLAAVVPVDNNQQSAREILRGVAQAQDQFNQSGGIRNRLLEIIIANDGNEPENSTKVAQQLVADPSILGIVGHNASNASQAGLKVYQQSELAMISPTSTSTALSSKHFFRTSPSDAASGIKLAQYVYEQLQINRAAIFYNPDSSYSSSLQTAFQNYFEQLGGKIVMFNLADTALKPTIAIAESIVQHQAKAGLLFADTGHISVAIEIAQANANLPLERRLKLLSGDSLYSSQVLTSGGKSIENLVLAVPWFVGAAKSMLFSQAAESKWGGTVNWRTAMSYDATQALIKALENSDTRREIRQNLTKIQLEVAETSGEQFAFTKDGERQSEPVLIKVTQGGIRPLNSRYGYSLIE